MCKTVSMLESNSQFTIDLPSELQSHLRTAATDAGCTEQEILQAVLAKALRHQPFTAGSISIAPELAAFVDDLYEGSGWDKP